MSLEHAGWAAALKNFRYCAKQFLLEAWLPRNLLPQILDDVVVGWTSILQLSVTSSKALQINLKVDALIKLRGSFKEDPSAIMARFNKILISVVPPFLNPYCCERTFYRGGAMLAEVPIDFFLRLLRREILGHIFHGSRIQLASTG